MVGCYGRAKDGQTIRLDLDNELQGQSSCVPQRLADVQTRSGSTGPMSWTSSRPRRPA